MLIFPFPLVFSLLVLQILGQSVDLTLQPATRGKDVVEATVKKIHTLGVFTKDKNFLRRIACAETEYGQAEHTYQIGNHGIWSISDRNLETSKDNASYPRLTRAFDAVYKAWGIDWMNARRIDMEKPFYSGLAARLYWLATFGDSLPGKLPEQARIYKLHYNASAASTAADFERRVEQCEKEKCSGRLNICIMMDGSGSIFTGNFELEKKFVSDLLGTFVNGSVKAAVVVYSSSVNVVFPLNSTLTWTERLAKIQSLTRPSGGTSTHLAIEECTKQFRQTPREENVARVGLVLTDGQSDSLAKVREASSEAARASITSYAVGIGRQTGAAELQLIAGDVSRVLNVEDFDELMEVFGQINEDACKVPQTPLTGQSVQDSVRKGEKRYFRFDLPETGLRLSVESLSGGTASYYSYDDETPSSALYDGTIGKEPVLVPFREPAFFDSSTENKDSIRNSTFVYVSVAGLEDSNEYVMKATVAEPSPSEKPSQTSGALASAFSLSLVSLLRSAILLFSSVL